MRVILRPVVCDSRLRTGGECMGPCPPAALLDSAASSPSNWWTNPFPRRRRRKDHGETTAEQRRLKSMLEVAGYIRCLEPARDVDCGPSTACHNKGEVGCSNQLAAVPRRCRSHSHYGARLQVQKLTAVRIHTSTAHQSTLLGQISKHQEAADEAGP